MRRRLFIPGPVEVHPEVLQALSVPMMGHRDKEYEVLHARTRDKLKKLLGVREGSVFLFTSSGTGGMESSVRNLSAKRILSVACGAFSERWHEVAKENGKGADLLSVEWGRANKPDEIEAKVKTGAYDLVTVCHNETSTGVMNPLPQIAEMMRSYPETLLAVDAVSSMAGVPIHPEPAGIDFLFAGVQKAFGLPPGLAVVYASRRALERAAKVPDRGHYFDLLSFQKMDAKNQTPETPVLSLIHALDVQLDRMFEEPMEDRYRRTQAMAERCRAWARERFALFPEEGYESVTLTCVRNTRGIDVTKLNAELAKRGVVISDGYGKLKNQTFRIAHMADIQPAELEQVLGWIDEIVKG